MANTQVCMCTAMDTPSLVPLTEPENEGGLHVRRPSFTPGYIAVA